MDNLLPLQKTLPLGAGGVMSIPLLFNDPVSNWILTILFFGNSVLSSQLISLGLRAYASSDKSFKKYLIKHLKVKNPNDKKQQEEAFDKYAAVWHRRDVSFRFLQALGPALGFILTVSSLISALNPALLIGNDINGFMTGIHVAMISTFLGLFLRIIALEASRVNDKLLYRAELQLKTNTHPPR